MTDTSSSAAPFTCVHDIKAGPGGCPVRSRGEQALHSVDVNAPTQWLRAFDYDADGGIFAPAVDTPGLPEPRFAG